MMSENYKNIGYDRIKEIFDDEVFIKSEKRGYTIWKNEINSLRI